ncbi:MAG: ABC transporter permease, partial [Anaerolineae bacterium]
TAMLGLIIYQVTLIIAAQSFTRERERGTLEQLRITPLGRVELIVGKAVPTLVVGLVDGLLMIGLIALWFEVPVRGSLLLLFSLFVPFILAQIGWGTLISLVSHNQQQAVLFVFALAMLEVACSGFIVPAADMPKVMQVISYASSVQHFLVILRGVMLRGAGFSSVWVPSLALTGIAFAAATIAWLRLRAGLDADSLQQRLRDAWKQHQERRQRKTVPSSRPTSKGRTDRKPRLVPEPVLSPARETLVRRRRKRS